MEKYLKRKAGVKTENRLFLDAKVMNYLIECSRFVLTKVGGRVKVPAGNLYLWSEPVFEMRGREADQGTG